MLLKTAIFRQKTLIFGLLDPFFRKIFSDFPLRGRGYPPFPLRVFWQNDFLLIFSSTTFPRAEGVCTVKDPATGLPKQTYEKKYKKEHKVGRP